MNLDKIKERIRRALAIARDDRNISKEEMSNAAALAAKLMAQYRIDEDSLVDPSSVKSSKIASFRITDSGQQKLQKWLWPIIRQLAKMNQCYPFSSGGEWYVIGEENCANAVRYLLSLISYQIDELANTEWKRHNCSLLSISEEDDIIIFSDSDSSSKSWKHSFRLGCATEVGNRLYALRLEMKKKLESGGVTESGGTLSNALAVINNRVNQVNRVVESMNFAKSTPTVSRSEEAYLSGKKAAHRVNIGTSAKGALK